MKFETITSINRCRFLQANVKLQCLLVFLLYRPVSGRLTTVPVNTEVVLQQRARLQCSTSETMEVYWQHIPVAATSPTYVYYDQQIVNGYNDRFTVERDDETGKYDLIIQIAQMSDAGTFRCLDRVGSGEISDAQLVVLESAPQCEASDLRFCDESTREVSVSCSINFAGNMKPEIDCRSSHIRQSTVCLPSSRTVTEDLPHRVNYSIQAMTKWSGTNSQNIICQTQLSNISSDINLIAPYAFSSSAAVSQSSSKSMTCSANSSESCSYRWIHNETGEIFEQQTLKVNAIGKYECIAECQLQTHDCRIKPTTVEITAQDIAGDSTHSNKSIIIMITIVVIIVVIVILCIAVVTIVLIKKRRKQNQKPNPEEISELFEDNSSKSTSTGQSTQSQTFSQSTETPRC